MQLELGLNRLMKKELTLTSRWTLRWSCPYLFLATHVYLPVSEGCKYLTVNIWSWTQALCWHWPSWTLLNRLLCFQVLLLEWLSILKIIKLLLAIKKAELKYGIIFFEFWKLFSYFYSCISIYDKLYHENCPLEQWAVLCKYFLSLHF